MINRDIKEILLLICHREGITQQHIIDTYNDKYNKTLSKQAFSASIKKGCIKYAVLFDILDSIGYQIEIKKRL